MSVTVAAKVIVCRPADSEVTTRLPRDHYVRPDGNDYSVHPAVIGRRVQVCADLDRVQVMCDDKTVADHERIWATHQTISDRAWGSSDTVAPHPHRCATTLRPVRRRGPGTHRLRRCPRRRSPRRGGLMSTKRPRAETCRPRSLISPRRSKHPRCASRLPGWPKVPAPRSLRTRSPRR